MKFLNAYYFFYLKVKNKEHDEIVICAFILEPGAVTNTCCEKKSWSHMYISVINKILVPFF
jgi:hypothetical protein